jgi:hypothetical protein
MTFKSTFRNKTLHQTAKVKVTAKMREILSQRFPARRSPNIPNLGHPRWNQTLMKQLKRFPPGVHLYLLMRPQQITTRD